MPADPHLLSHEIRRILHSCVTVHDYERELNNLKDKLLRAEPVAVPSSAPAVTGATSDGYHTFDELYDYRKALNALLFNEWAARGLCDVHKAWRHSDGEPCFGGGWFIVVAQTPGGQISNHYKAQDWDLFQVPKRDRSAEYDGHTPKIALERMLQLASAPVAVPAPTDWLMTVADIRTRLNRREAARVLSGAPTIEAEADLVTLLHAVAGRKVVEGAVPAPTNGLDSVHLPQGAVPAAPPSEKGKEMADSLIDHPSHYGGADNPYEAIKVIEAWRLDFHLGNVVKYISRNGQKEGASNVDDLRKARWYLDRKIQRLEKAAAPLPVGTAPSAAAQTPQGEQ